MFPKELDHAQVLYYTNKGDYGFIYYSNGEVFDKKAYYAVCAYPGDSQFYLFTCNAEFNVIADFPEDSINKCKELAARDFENLVWHDAFIL